LHRCYFALIASRCFRSAVVSEFVLSFFYMYAAMCGVCMDQLMLQAQAEAATVGDESDAAMVQLQAKIRARRDEAKRQKKVRTAGLEPQLYGL
jgi:hypothetical protein